MGGQGARTRLNERHRIECPSPLLRPISGAQRARATQLRQHGVRFWSIRRVFEDGAHELEGAGAVAGFAF